MTPASFLSEFQAKVESLYPFVEEESDKDIQFCVRMHSTALGDDYTSLMSDALQLLKHKYPIKNTLAWQKKPYLTSEVMRDQRFVVLKFNISEGEKHGQ